MRRGTKGRVGRGSGVSILSPHGFHRFTCQPSGQGNVSIRRVANRERDRTHREVRSSTSEAGLGDFVSFCYKASRRGTNIFRVTYFKELHDAEIYAAGRSTPIPILDSMGSKR